MCDANTLETIGYVWVCLCFSQCMYHVIDAIVFQFHWFCKLFASFCEQPLAPAMQTSNWFINYFSFHARPFLSLSHTLFFSNLHLSYMYMSSTLDSCHRFPSVWTNARIVHKCSVYVSASCSHEYTHANRLPADGQWWNTLWMTTKVYYVLCRIAWGGKNNDSLPAPWEISFLIVFLSLTFWSSKCTLSLSHTHIH